jgi:hypothetical protein
MTDAQNKIDYLQPPLAYLVRIPVPDADAGSPLDEGARGRAEDAARWLNFQPVNVVVCSPGEAAEETAEILHHGNYTSEKIVDAQLAESLLGYIKDRGPHALVLRQQEIRAALASLGVSSLQKMSNRDAQVLTEEAAANVCAEPVAPGGIISIHQQGEGLRAIARMRVLDFSFTDFVETVSVAE